MKRSFIAALGLATAFAFVVGTGASATSQAAKLVNRFAPSGIHTVDPLQSPLVPIKAPKGVKAPTPAPTGTSGCSDMGTNVRADQDCTNQSAAGFLGRSQSQNETAAAVNPTNASNVLLAQNDYRRGDGTCGVDWSIDGGKHWGNTLLPVGFTAPGFVAPRHYWTTSGDPSVAFDTSGTAYMMCGAFDRGGAVQDVAACPGSFCGSALVLFRSTDGGASWEFPGSIVTENDGSTVGLLDKQYMTIDTNPSSPHLNRIYVTWSNYSTSFTSDPIYLAYSDDFGNSWTVTPSISGNSSTLCPINFSGAPAGTCDSNQFSDPFVAPNGDVYVAFQNFNNCSGSLRAFGFHCPGPASDNHNQILIVKSINGGASFSSPVKVSNFYDLPDCFNYTGQDIFRSCVPTQPLSPASIFRATEYPAGVALSNTSIDVTLGSYINADSNHTLGNCSPAGLSLTTGLNLYSGVGTTNGCNSDIVLSVSTNGGASFTGTTADVATLPSVSREATGTRTDQWWQWAALSSTDKLVVSYYDRSYGTDESTGFNDVTLTEPAASFFTRVTNVSLPPSNEFPDTSGYSDFLGDYSGLAVGSDGKAHPVWSDTRNPIFTFNSTAGADPRSLTFAGYGSDIYTRSISVP